MIFQANQNIYQADERDILLSVFNEDGSAHDLSVYDEVRLLLSPRQKAQLEYVSGTPSLVQRQLTVGDGGMGNPETHQLALRLHQEDTQNFASGELWATLTVLGLDGEPDYRAHSKAKIGFVLQNNSVKPDPYI